MFKRLVVAVTAGMVLASLMSPATAGPRRIKGSYTASAKPLPSPWVAGPVAGCESGVEGVHKVSHPLVAPFDGWLRVKMTFGGQWDLSLEDPSGTYLANSEHQFNTDEPVERLDYHLEAGEEVVIVACNFASHTAAEVSYALTEGPAWETRPGGKKISRIEELSYASPALSTAHVYAICYLGYELGCTATHPRSTDRFVSVQVTDDASPNVAFEVYQYVGNTYHGGENFCGATDEPVAVKPGATLIGVTVHLGPCEDGTAAMATKGTVLMEFSNRR